MYVDMRYQVDTSGSGPPRATGPKLKDISHTDGRWVTYGKELEKELEGEGGGHEEDAVSEVRRMQAAMLRTQARIFGKQEPEGQKEEDEEQGQHECRLGAGGPCD